MKKLLPVICTALFLWLAPTALGNVIADPSFETTPFPSSLVDFNDTVSQVALSGAPDGTHVAQVSIITADASQGWDSIDYNPAVSNATAGTTYDASDYVEAANSSTVGKPVVLTIREQTPSGATVGSADSSTVNLTSTGFQNLKTSYNVKNTGDQLDVYVTQGSTVAGNAFYDDLLSLTQNTHVVPSAPSGPATPSGGWSVVYGDAFGSCLANAGTSCSSGYARSDNSWGPETSAHGDSNADEIASFVPAENDVTTSGLAEKCIAKATSTDAYSCGSVNGYSVNASHGFAFVPTAGRFVLQFTAQLPPDEGNMDPAFWSTGNSYAWELDHPEFWGWLQDNTGKGGNTWASNGVGFPVCPQPRTGCALSGGSRENDLYFGVSPAAEFDPSAGMHTYTLDIQQTSSSILTAYAYIDGVAAGSVQYNRSAFGSTPGEFILQNDLRCLSGNSTCVQGPTATTAVDGGHFPASGNQMLVKDVVVYAPTSQGTAGTTNFGLAPGTDVGS